MRSKKAFRTVSGCLLAGIFSLCFIGTAMANLGIVRAYKDAFPGEQPKCTYCHVDKTPKKEEGKHEWNDYGKKILAAKKELKKEQVDEEVLKKVGKNETAAAE